ncbi:hypothetical protein [Ureibacillus acetophenoni]|uniref:YfhE-like protein n=1 Tax=Ureibacillus acetophenoni TaxID=614649 RepID=A0A285U3H7_9BACL|nr:hypothetical protein [Ureibacillus acetophenoni]SOC36510.1 hypothetical protein SAMN05877842_102431 [Ureibacillus acetophenoni]
MKGKQPHEQLTTNDNALTKMQEVTYKKEFKEMESGSTNTKNNQSQNQNKKYNL